jgi:hypothetical protein
VIKNIEFFEIPSIKTAFGKRKSSLYVSEKVVGGAKILSYGLFLALYFAFEGAEALFVTIYYLPAGLYF